MGANGVHWRGLSFRVLHEDPVSGMTFFKHLAALIGPRLVDSYKATLAAHGERGPRFYGYEGSDK